MEEYAMEEFGSECNDSEQASILDIDTNWNWDGEQAVQKNVYMSSQNLELYSNFRNLH